MNEQTLASTIEAVAAVDANSSLDEMIKKYIELGVICDFFR